MVLTAELPRCWDRGLPGGEAVTENQVEQVKLGLRGRERKKGGVSLSPTASFNSHRSPSRW